MNDQSIMPFGAHKGKKLANVPASYFIYLWEQATWFSKTSDLGKYIEDNLDDLKKELKS